MREECERKRKMQTCACRKVEVNLGGAEGLGAIKSKYFI